MKKCIKKKLKKGEKKGEEKKERKKKPVLTFENFGPGAEGNTTIFFKALSIVFPSFMRFRVFSHQVRSGRSVGQSAMFFPPFFDKICPLSPKTFTHRFNMTQTKFHISLGGGGDAE